MTIALESIPRFTPGEALSAAQLEYGIVGEISPLPSERDQNYLISDRHCGKFVLKIANASDAHQQLDCQNKAMRHVGRWVADCRVQQTVVSLRGSEVANIRNVSSGTDHCVRLLTWIEGDVLADSHPRSSALFESIGAGLARIDAALSHFAHPATRRVLQWDLRRAALARDNARLLPRGRRSRVEFLFSRWEAIDWTVLRHSVIHGDANDYNVIVAGGHMAGLLDFGDMVHSATVCDLAIALAYVMLDEQEPLTAAVQVIRAYHRHYPLTDAEQQVLVPLVLSRLCMSVCYSAHNRKHHPNDPYQVVTEAAAWDLLGRLEGWSEEDALALVRTACSTGQ